MIGFILDMLYFFFLDEVAKEAFKPKEKSKK